MEELRVTDDWYGDLMREFFAKYGAAGEGPTPDMNLCELFGIGATVSGDLEADIEFIKRMCANPRLSAMVQDCHSLLFEIRQSPKGPLYKEIDTYFDDMGIEPTAVSQGILWYTQAANADPRDGKPGRRFFRKAVESGILPLKALSNQVTGATILRLYVALVYLRGDWFRQSLGKTIIDSAPSLFRYARLLNHDIVRHLRNSLAHGHIVLTCVGLRIKDRDFEVVLTPDILNLICMAIWLLHCSILTVYAIRNEIEDLPGTLKLTEEERRTFFCT